jgi:hypothetical protein
MEARLNELARKLRDCRRKGNKLNLETVLHSARILTEAKTISRRRFGLWLRRYAHMDSCTANRHIRVAAFVKANVSLTPKIANLSLAKIYALSTLDFDHARRFLNGQEALSAPLEMMSDVQFRQEFRERFPSPKKRRTHQHIFQELYSALTRLERALGRAWRRISELKPRQQRLVARKLQTLAKAAQGWKIVA